MLLASGRAIGETASIQGTALKVVFDQDDNHTPGTRMHRGLARHVSFLYEDTPDGLGDVCHMPEVDAHAFPRRNVQLR